MIYYINFFVSNFVLDFFVGVLLKKDFRLSVKKIELFFLQIFNLAPVVLYLFCGFEFYAFLLMKILSNFLICLLITDSFKFLNLSKLFAFNLFIGFSVYGFCEFFKLIFKVVFESYFNQKIAKNLDFMVIIAMFCYFSVIFAFFKKMSKEKTIRNFLSKVSFCLYGKHIEVVGLLDSGNSLVDTKTGKGVIVISAKSLRNFFDNFDYEMVLKNGFCSRKISCEVAGGLCFEMPVVDIGKATVASGFEKKSFDCVLGIVNQKFYDEKRYDCLLYREFF